MAANLGTATLELNTDDSKLNSGLASALGAVQRFGREAEGAGKGFTILGGALANVAGSLATSAITGLTQSFIGLGKGVIQAGVDVDTSLNKFQAVAGTSMQQAGISLDDVRQKAIQIGVDFPLSTKDAADGLYALATAGFSAKDAMTASYGVAQLAASQNMTMGDSAQIVAGTLNAFKMGADQASTAVGILSATANASAVEVKDVAETMSYAGPVAGALGYSMKDLSVATGLMGNAMIKGSMAGTSLRTIMTSLANAHSKGSDAIHALGIEIIDASGKMVPFGTVMNELRDKTQGMTDAQKAQLAQTIAGKTGMSGLLTIMNSSQKQFDDMTAAVNDGAGALDKYTKATQQGLGYQLQQAKGSVEALQIALYGGLQPALTKITAQFVSGLGMPGVQTTLVALGKDIGAFLLRLDDLAIKGFDLVRDSIITFKEATGGNWVNKSGILPLHRGVGELGLGVEKLRLAWIAFMGGLEGSSIGKAAASFGGIVTAAEGAGAALRSFHTIVGNIADKLQTSANPTIAKFGGALADLSSGDFGAAFRDLQQALGPVVTTMWNLVSALSPTLLAFDVIKGVLEGGLNGGLQALSDHFDKLTTTLNTMGPPGQFIAGVLQTVKGVVVTVAQAIQDNWPTVITIFNNVKTAIGKVVDAVSPLVTGIIRLATTAGPSILKGFGQVWNDIAPIVGKVVGMIGSYIGTMMQIMGLAINWVTAHWPEISSTIAGVYDTVIAPALKLFSTALDLIGTVVGSVVSFVVEHWPEISGAISTAWNEVISPIFGLIGKAIGILIGVWSTVIGFVVEHWPEISAALKFAYDTVIKPVMGKVGEAVTEAHTIIKGIIDFVVEHWPEVSSAIKTAWDTVIKPTMDKIGEIINTVVLPAIKGIISWVSEHWSEISSAVDTAWKTFIQPALNTMGDIINNTVLPAIKGIVGWVQSNFHFFGDVIDTVTKPIKGIFDGISAAAGILGGALDTLLGKSKSLEAAKTGLAGVAQLVGGVASGTSAQPGAPQSGIKSYDIGGWVDAPIGQPQLAFVHGGEYVVPADAFSGTAGGSMWANSPIPPIQTLVRDVFTRIGDGLKATIDQTQAVANDYGYADNMNDPARQGWFKQNQGLSNSFGGPDISAALAAVATTTSDALTGGPLAAIADTLAKWATDTTAAETTAGIGIGQALVQGITAGVTNSQGDLRAALASLTRALPSASNWNALPALPGAGMTRSVQIPASKIYNMHTVINNPQQPMAELQRDFQRFQFLREGGD